MIYLELRIGSLLTVIALSFSFLFIDGIIVGEIACIYKVSKLLKVKQTYLSRKPKLRNLKEKKNSLCRIKIITESVHQLVNQCILKWGKK